MSRVAVICPECRRPHLKQTRCGCTPDRQAARRRAKTIVQGRASRHWQLVRRARLLLDGHRCQLRLLGCTTVATSVHLDPAFAGDHSRATVENTLSACARCHGRVDGGRAHG